ncbi:class I SAM-dependent methyltransferase [Methanolobus profundi]|uniref:Methyltransferase domain-containing protein n=1 Tax=Methanolobus profundi TaxID=487685 RepID=A0A1I4NIP6_9EURY|nr:class I SAM-dependent methyltransferase [Methanolobus profundi]SFM15053.1 Methyltransferase domain-containing protein [Methanolobus profundi]
MDNRKLSISEIEEMDYYSFMSYLGVPYFHVGGPRSTEELANLCHIDRTSKVLIVGCGSGFSACYLSKRKGCSVIGVDIAEGSVKNARIRAFDENIENKTEFLTGDAYNLPFSEASFDIVITEFVSQFLDKERAFEEFMRVIGPEGYLGINEMYRDSNIEPHIKAKIDEAETIFTEVTGLQFNIHTPEEWEHYFKRTGSKDINIYKHRPFERIRDMLGTFKAMGGILRTTAMILRMLKYTILSKDIRRRFSRLDKGKRILFNKRSTRKHVGYILGTAKKGI